MCACGVVCVCVCDVCVMCVCVVCVCVVGGLCMWCVWGMCGVCVVCVVGGVYMYGCVWYVCGMCVCVCGVCVVGGVCGVWYVVCVCAYHNISTTIYFIDDHLAYTSTGQDFRKRQMLEFIGVVKKTSFLQSLLLVKYLTTPGNNYDGEKDLSIDSSFYSNKVHITIPGTTCKI